MYIIVNTKDDELHLYIRWNIQDGMRIKTFYANMVYIRSIFNILFAILSNWVTKRKGKVGSSMVIIKERKYTPGKKEREI